MKAIIVTAWPRKHGITIWVQPALEGCSSVDGGAIVVDNWLVHGSSIERKTADHCAGLEHWAGIGAPADARVICCSA